MALAQLWTPLQTLSELVDKSPMAAITLWDSILSSSGDGRHSPDLKVKLSIANPQTSPRLPMAFLGHRPNQLMHSEDGPPKFLAMPPLALATAISQASPYRQSTTMLPSQPSSSTNALTSSTQLISWSLKSTLTSSGRHWSPQPMAWSAIFTTAWCLLPRRTLPLSQLMQPPASITLLLLSLTSNQALRATGLSKLLPACSVGMERLNILWMMSLPLISLRLLANGDILIHESLLNFSLFWTKIYAL